jgi:IS30 family transposase
MGMPGNRLCLDERIKIEAWWVAGWTIPDIAEGLGRQRSTIWRELTHHHSYRHGPKNPLGARDGRSGLGGVYRWGYCAGWAEKAARQAARRPRRCKLGGGSPLRSVVVKWLTQRWSPHEIAARLLIDYPDEPEMRVSHETVYRALYLQSRGGLRDEIAAQVALRSGRAQRRSRPVAAGPVRSRRPWVEGFHISSRPPEVEDRAVPGHWEGDLLLGTGSSSAIVTLVERTTRYVLLGALPGAHNSDSVIPVLSTLIQRLPEQLRLSLTWDQGGELAGHARFTVITNCPVFFCDPHSPWQRGSNENTNGLLRQYFPKGKTNFRLIDQDQLDHVARELNGRPRQTLHWKNPAEALNEVLVATAG